MNNQTEALLEEIITKHDFIVRVYAPEETQNCVAVDFAGRKFVIYEVDLDIVDGITFVEGVNYTNIIDVNAEDGQIEEFIPVTTATTRLYILLDIYRQCQDLGLPREIVRFFAADGSKIEWHNLLQLSLSDEDADAEAALNRVMYKLINNHTFEVARMYVKLEEAGLTHQFLILRGLL